MMLYFFKKIRAVVIFAHTIAWSGFTISTNFKFCACFPHLTKHPWRQLEFYFIFKITSQKQCLR